LYKKYKMASGICVISVIAVRSEPSDKAEMVSQLLFGELFEILETSGSWLNIRNLFDDYEGWIDAKQCKRLSQHEVEVITSFKTYIASDLVQLIDNKTTKTTFPILLGSALPGLIGTKMNIAAEDYEFDSDYVDPVKPSDGNKIAEVSLQYLNAPYLWGGRTPFGIDCSGLTQIAMKICGLKIPRDAAQQALTGTTIDFITEALPGDLAFFENADYQIIHAGILLNDHSIIHASGFVRIDAIDHEGIFNTTAQRYTHKLKLLKRYI
jgi:gamma-D-glutamyl-L-lysine dipeptidyl-peptidase